MYVRKMECIIDWPPSSMCQLIVLRINVCRKGGGLTNSTNEHTTITKPIYESIEGLPYKEGELFYRCRISTEDGIPIEEMGAPPIDKTTDGRANARGIRCLYLGDTAETTIYETRAGAYDYVTVGKFQLKKDIIVVDLKKINECVGDTEADVDNAVLKAEQEAQVSIADCSKLIL